MPTFKEIKNEADAVLDLNQKNMEDESERARAAARLSTQWMILALIGSAVVATAIALGLSRSILEPIRSVTQAARAMAEGDLDQVVPVLTRDELGELAGSFNAMARTIREYPPGGDGATAAGPEDRTGHDRLVPRSGRRRRPARFGRAGQPGGRTYSGRDALRRTGRSRGSRRPRSRGRWTEVLGGRGDYLPTGLDHALCLRDDGQERFFLPRVLSIRGEGEGTLGAAVVLSDVTKFRLVDQLKSDMVSTVSHELKTPLTSVQMVVHLLLEEVVGPLTAKQVELLLAARQDSDRLLAMVNDLLDLTRIEQGRLRLDLEPLAPDVLINEAVERFEANARDAGVTLEAAGPTGLPEVLADHERIGHVFDNLIGNALRHTGRGGTVRVTAEAVDGSGPPGRRR